MLLALLQQPGETQSSAANFQVYLHDDAWHHNFPVTSADSKDLHAVSGFTGAFRSDGLRGRRSGGSDWTLPD